MQTTLVFRSGTVSPPIKSIVDEIDYCQIVAMSANAHLLPSSPLVDSTMQRPASRGGPVKPKMLAGMEGDSKAPMMGGGGMPAAMGMTRGGMTGTARGGARPNSALKRVPTAQKVEGPPPGMVGLSTDVKVEARPLTSGGLSGMASRGAGPGRQLADVSYWRMELRNKIADITRETESVTPFIVISAVVGRFH